MPSRPSDAERQRQARWQRPSRTAARLAALLATVEGRAAADADAYFRRLRQLLGAADFDRLMGAWAEVQETPADLVPILDADEATVQLRRSVEHVAWLLFCALRGSIPSEHYWYANLGRAKPPKEWEL